MSGTIDRSSHIPYYVQVMDAIRERIRQGDWQPGHQLPGEPDLCRVFNVSRTVIRQALQALMYEGLIIRHKGKGTFVAEPKISGGLVQRLTGFYEDMLSHGYRPVSRVLKQQTIPASPRIAEYLAIPVGTDVIEIERLRLVNEEPIVLVWTYVPYTLCPGLLQADLTHQSLYGFLEQQCQLVIARGRRIIEAVPANEYESELLQVPRAAPLILLDSVSYLEDGTPVEYYHALHRGNRTRFEVELVRVREHGEERVVLGGHPPNLPIPSRIVFPPES